MKEFQTKPINAVNIVKNRIQQINAQSRIAELDTLSRLERLIRSSHHSRAASLCSYLDGFVVDIKRSNGADVMQRPRQ